VLKRLFPRCPDSVSFPPCPSQFYAPPFNPICLDSPHTTLSFILFPMLSPSSEPFCQGCVWLRGGPASAGGISFLPSQFPSVCRGDPSRTRDITGTTPVASPLSLPPASLPSLIIPCQIIGEARFVSFPLRPCLPSRILSSGGIKRTPIEHNRRMSLPCFFISLLSYSHFFWILSFCPLLVISLVDCD